MKSNNSLFGLSRVCLTVAIILASCLTLRGSAQCAPLNHSDASVAANLQSVLNKGGIVRMLETASVKHYDAPSIVSSWRLERIGSPEERRAAVAWRSLGESIITKVDEDALRLRTTSDITVLQDEVKLMLDLADWFSHGEGYGNLTIARRCLDLASVGLARLFCNLNDSHQKTKDLFARFGTSVRSLGIDSCIRVLNSEAGEQMFALHSNQDQVRRVWGEGRVLLGDRTDPLRKLNRQQVIEESPIIMRNLEFFADPDWPASLPRTTRNCWGVKWHERIVNGMITRNMKSLESLAKFRLTVGRFPEASESKDELRPGREGAFHKAWIAKIGKNWTEVSENQEELRLVGITAWYAFDRVQGGMFLDEDVGLEK